MREQYIFETNTVNGGFLVDRRTNQIVGTTSNGVDQYFAVAKPNPLTGGIANSIWNGTQAQYDAIVTKDPNTIYLVA